MFIGVGSKFIDPNYKDDGSKNDKVEVIKESVNPPLEEEPKKEEQQQNQPNEEPKKNEGEGESGREYRADSIKLNPDQAKIIQRKKKKCC